jgi:hypothetical protein
MAMAGYAAVTIREKGDYSDSCALAGRVVDAVSDRSNVSAMKIVLIID